MHSQLWWFGHQVKSVEEYVGTDQVIVVTWNGLTRVVLRSHLSIKIYS